MTSHYWSYGVWADTMVTLTPTLMATLSLSYWHWEGESLWGALTHCGDYEDIVVMGIMIWVCHDR